MPQKTKPPVNKNPKAQRGITCGHVHHVVVLQHGDWVNAYCTKCGAAANLHIKEGGAELLAIKERQTQQPQKPEKPSVVSTDAPSPNRRTPPVNVGN